MDIAGQNAGNGGSGGDRTRRESLIIKGLTRTFHTFECRVRARVLHQRRHRPVVRVPSRGTPSADEPEREISGLSGVPSQIASQKPVALSHDLTQVVTAWDKLSAPLKAAILAIAGSVTEKGVQ